MLSEILTLAKRKHKPKLTNMKYNFHTIKSRTWYGNKHTNVTAHERQINHTTQNENRIVPVSHALWQIPDMEKLRLEKRRK